MRFSGLPVAVGIVLLSIVLLEAQAPPAPGLIRDVASGTSTLIVKGDGTVVTWGRTNTGAFTPVPVVLDLPGKVLKVAVGGGNLGSFAAYAVLEDRTVIAWGANDEGQLGNGPAGANGELGRYPKPSPTPVKVTGLTNIIDIAAGNKHAVALREDGTVWAWGTRDAGALGGGDAMPAGNLRVVSSLAPIRVPGLEGITHIAVGGTHNLALTRDGQVMSWGTGHSGELGVGTRDVGWRPAKVIGLDDVVAIAAGVSASNGVSGAVRRDGTVWMWGSGVSGMMGNGGGLLAAPDAPGGRVLLPQQVKGLVGVQALAIGGGNVAALLGDGTLRMWGHNGYGEMGVGAGQNYESRPVKTGLTDVVAVYLSNMRSMAVRKDGSFWFWGFPYGGANGALAKTQKVPTRLELP